MHAAKIEDKPSLYKVVEEILGLLKDRDVKRIGLWGSGGIGKTTIMRNLNNHEDIAKMFDIVIWVTISKDRSEEKLQRAITDWLKMNMEGITNPDEIAWRISKELECKKYLLLLDEVWNILDLPKLGIQDNQKDSKVVLATRFPKICCDMKTELINMKQMFGADAWKMFTEKVGQNVNLPFIEPIAKLVVRECVGFPLLIDKVASTFRQKKDNSFLWNYGLTSLRRWDSFKVQGMDELIESLKFCYEAKIEDKPSLYKVVEEVLGLLKDRDVKRIGLWGSGGIGKTTIMRNLNNHEDIAKMFDIVIWVTISKDRSEEKLQRAITDRLKMNMEGITNPDEIAWRISKELECKKYLLLLDEVWNILDLPKLGIQDNQKDSKVVLATRFPKICCDIKTELINMKQMFGADAWKMFTEKVGQNVNLPFIEPIAKLVVRECVGFPLLIDKVASTFRQKKDNSFLWNYGLTSLRRWDSFKVQGIDELIESLKFCYEEDLSPSYITMHQRQAHLTTVDSKFVQILIQMLGKVRTHGHGSFIILPDLPSRDLPSLCFKKSRGLLSHVIESNCSKHLVFDSSQLFDSMEGKSVDEWSCSVKRLDTVTISRGGPGQGRGGRPS
uniref:AAA+ ATPase domain-containing protein n=1 Tax=Fagus sylvatica TaxID=28930 RepID=A0A2N9HRG8_FAGSY